MAHSLQDGLPKFERLLARMADNPDQLEYDRGRFEDPIPSESPPPSGNTTPSVAPPRVRDLEAELRDKREEGWRTSFPSALFQRQVALETFRYSQAMKNDCRPIPNHRGASGLAVDRVVNEWMEQGIWALEWDPPNEDKVPVLLGFWLHEDEKGPDHAKIPGEDWDIDLPRFPVTAHPKTKSDPNSSRPIHQFTYQVNKEREWFEDCHRAKVEGFPSPDSTNINTQAYNSVKKRWKEWGIWDSEWGVLPGMSWLHEMPLGEFLERERRKDAAAAAANGTADQDQDQDLSVYASPVPSPSSDGISVASDDRNLDLRQFIVHGNNSLESLVDKPASQAAKHSPVLDPATGPVAIDSGSALDKSPRNPPSHPAETVPAPIPAADSSPEPSITKAGERNARYKRWTALFHRQKDKTSKDSSRRLKFLKYNIRIDHEDKVVKQ